MKCADILKDVHTCCSASSNPVGTDGLLLQISHWNYSTQTFNSSDDDDDDDDDDNSEGKK